MTEHASGEDLSGSLLATIPTTDAINTQTLIRVQRNARGGLGFHMAVDWAVAGTVWTVPGPGSQSTGGYYNVDIMEACY